jgi:hypothetical protein
MKLFLISFTVIFISLFGMAIGAIVNGKYLKGSCGGLGKIMGEDCLFCDKKDECDKKKLSA